MASWPSAPPRRDVRASDSKAYAFLNDTETPISAGALEMQAPRVTRNEAQTPTAATDCSTPFGAKASVSAIVLACSVPSVLPLPRSIARVPVVYLRMLKLPYGYSQLEPL